MSLFNRHRVRASILGAMLASSMALVTPAAAQQAEDDSAAAETTSIPRAERLDLNRATAEELQALPGVGPSRAQAIVALRDKLKGFQRSEDLMRVRGIGRKTFRKIAPLVRVDAPSKR